MYPVIRILNMTLYSYKLMGGLAAILGVILSFWKLKTYKLGLWRWLLPPAMAIFAFVGARIWNYSVNPGQFGGNFPIWKLYYSNLSLYGGLLGALLVLIAFSYIKRLSFLYFWMPLSYLQAYLLYCSRWVAFLTVAALESVLPPYLG